MDESQSLVCLYSFIPFGPQRIKLLHSYFGSYKDAWNATGKELAELGVKQKLADAFILHKSKFSTKEYFSKLEKMSIQFVTEVDEDYPDNLRDLTDAPPVLYIKGKLNKGFMNSIAIVGSRKMTSYGREVAERFAGELASMGITIISGLALGIDAAAHRAALDAGGTAVAVLASGLDTISPYSNLRLGLELIKKGGAIVSEYPLGHPPHHYNFPRRNRIISGLSKGVVVIEGAEKSGTLITASAAADQGRTVFAVPGQITSPLSGAPHFLIKNGAVLVTSAKDVLEELDIQLIADRQMVEKILPAGPDESNIIDILTNEPLHLDELARISGLAVNTISARLTIMELKGIVRHTGNGVYKKL